MRPQERQLAVAVRPIDGGPQDAVQTRDAVLIAGQAVAVSCFGNPGRMLVNAAERVEKLVTGHRARTVAGIFVRSFDHGVSPAVQG